MRPSTIAAAILAAGWLAAPAAANAQVQQPGVSEPAQEITDQKLDAAAAAMTEFYRLWFAAAERQGYFDKPSDSE